MALQLAWYKTRGSFTATYETALTHSFDKARTGTIRTLTEDSRAWVLSMIDKSTTVCHAIFPVPPLVLIKLIKAVTLLAHLSSAIQRHTSLSRGSDRPGDRSTSTWSTTHDAS